jgi:hypothetical protein
MIYLDLFFYTMVLKTAALIQRKINELLKLRWRINDKWTTPKNQQIFSLPTVIDEIKCVHHRQRSRAFYS